MGGAVADLGLADYAIVALATMGASVVGGVAGYGMGLLLPLVLVPLIGAQDVVPVLGLAALLINGSRWLAFRHFVIPRTAIILTAAAAIPCLFGSYLYTMLSGPQASIVIGAMLVVAVPLRHFFKRRQAKLPEAGMAAAGAGYGLLLGGTAGSGVILNAVLLMAGLEGAAVVGTDACVSMFLGVVKSGTFQAAGALNPSLWLLAGVIGLASVPGAFLAAALTRRLPLRLHTALLDTVVVLGGALILTRGILSFV